MTQLDLFNVLALNLWLAFAFICGRVARKVTRSPAGGWLIGLLFAAAPYLNVLPSWWSYRQAVQRDGGTWIENALEFDSLLVQVASTGGDPMRRCLLSMFCTAALDGRLAAAEIPEPEATPPGTRFVRLFVSRAGDPRCEELAQYSAQGGKNEFWSLASGECFATERVTVPRSRYEVTWGGSELQSIWLASPLFGESVQIHDRESGKLVASSQNYSTRPRPFWGALPALEFDAAVRRLTIERLREGPREGPRAGPRAGAAR